MQNKNFKKINNAKNSGFALLMAVIVTSTLLLVTYALTSIALKQLTLSFAGQASQIAFYAADTGVECALFWDLKNPRGTETAFATDQVNTDGINCNGNEIGNDMPVNTVPNQSTSVIGGSGSPATSTFQFFINGSSDTSGPCAIVRVGKKNSTVVGHENDIITTIQSRGYNTCNTSDPRRLERALEVTY